jgi:hypothetical protein
MIAVCATVPRRILRRTVQTQNKIFVRKKGKMQYNFRAQNLKSHIKAIRRDISNALSEDHPILILFPQITFVHSCDIVTISRLQYFPHTCTTSIKLIK